MQGKIFPEFTYLSVLHDTDGRGDGGVGLSVPAQGPRLSRQGGRLSTPRHQGTLLRTLYCTVFINIRC
jgi:hypothetical protein